MKIMNVVGARPNFMKIAPIIEEIKKYPAELRQLLVHTGQHYGKEMSDNFFNDLNLPEPDYFLGVGSGSHAEQTAQIMVKFEEVLMKEQPNVVILVGDVNSTLACSIVSTKIEYPNENEIKSYDKLRRPLVVHVEAGLRSFDRSMPEEINRIVTDSLSDFLFTTSQDANENLIKEGINPEKIFFVGNVMIDTLLRYRDRAKESSILRSLGLGTRENNGSWKLKRDYAVLTLHRPSNVDRPDTLQGILAAMVEVAEQIPIIFPVHPRTRKEIEAFSLQDYVNDISNCSNWLNNKIHCIEPLSYLDFLQLITNSKLVFTDSGGLQEETTVLGIPCVTLRENTERPVTVWEGTNVLAGNEKDNITMVAFDVILEGRRNGRIPKLWDGKAAERIVDILKKSILNG
ncbi:MAG: non-hydrolyzing UDP-N-acetylglucosamine 2-epimerase [Thermodesulfobacteriota bacterium]